MPTSALTIRDSRLCTVRLPSISVVLVEYIYYRQRAAGSCHGPPRHPPRVRAGVCAGPVARDRRARVDKSIPSTLYRCLRETQCTQHIMPTPRPPLLLLWAPIPPQIPGKASVDRSCASASRSMVSREASEGWGFGGHAYASYAPLRCPPPLPVTSGWVNPRAPDTRRAEGLAGAPGALAETSTSSQPLRLHRRRGTCSKQQRHCAVLNPLAPPPASQPPGARAGYVEPEKEDTGDPTPPHGRLRPSLLVPPHTARESAASRRSSLPGETCRCTVIVT